MLQAQLDAVALPTSFHRQVSTHFQRKFCKKIDIRQSRPRKMPNRTMNYRTDSALNSCWNRKLCDSVHSFCLDSIAAMLNKERCRAKSFKSEVSRACRVNFGDRTGRGCAVHTTLNTGTTVSRGQSWRTYKAQSISTVKVVVFPPSPSYYLA